jgi:hypothetical protein
LYVAHAGLWLVRDTSAGSLQSDTYNDDGGDVSGLMETGVCFLEKRPPERYLETVRAGALGAELFFLPLPTWTSFVATFPELTNRVQLLPMPFFSRLRENKAHCKIDILAAAICAFFVCRRRAHHSAG